MHKWSLPLLLTLIFLLPVSVQAQVTPSIAKLDVELWPEYDRPNMLVIYHIELSPQVTLPVDLSIRIPTAAGEPNAVAIRQGDGSLLNEPYERHIVGEWAFIDVTAALPDIQLEYYDPQLTKDGSNRHFEFTWLSDYPVESMRVVVQQPLEAREMVVSPNPAQSTQGTDGLMYHSIDLGLFQVGETATVTVDYTKDTDTLSIERLQVQPSAPISENTQGRVNIMDVLPWGLGALGVVLLVGGAWWYWQTGREKPQARKPSRGLRTPQIATETGNEAIYCSQCGKRAAPGDRFCRSCGSKLRSA